MYLLSIPAAVLAIATSIAFAQQSDTQPAPEDILLQGLYRAKGIEQFIADQVSPLRSADRAGDGLDRGDIDYVVTKLRAQERANSISRILRCDLDGDLRVNESEIKTCSETGEDGRPLLEDYDANGDDTISVEEAAASDRDFGYGTLSLERLLELDPNHDGVLTSDELRALAERVFQSVDRDRDGRISEEEYRAVSNRMAQARELASTPVCNLPKATAGSSVVAYGGYEGDSISSAAVGGLHQETNLIDVVIEPGPEPLYLSLTSYESMVWRVTGAVDRLERVVVASGQTGRIIRAEAQPSGSRPDIVRGIGGISASGVIGVPASKVSITRPDCIRSFYQTDDGTKQLVSESLRRSVGKVPSAIIGHYGAQRVDLPSGRIVEAKEEEAALPQGFDPVVWQDAAGYWPGGLVTVDPKQVVAATKVQPYQVLPSQMGLAQWVGAGAIERLPDRKFRILRPIPRMPPSMGGAHSVILIVAKGVPTPPGDQGHSCVIFEVDGTSKGATCPRE